MFEYLPKKFSELSRILKGNFLDQAEKINCFTHRRTAKPRKFPKFARKVREFAKNLMELARKVKDLAKNL